MGSQLASGSTYGTGAGLSRFTWSLTWPRPRGTLPLGAQPCPWMSMPNMLRDLVSLAKPTISVLSVMMAALGLWLAPQAAPLGVALATLLGTALIVGSANALNMAIERDVDALMTRTKKRPLPAGRMTVRTAVVFGVAIGVAGLALLALVSGPLPAGLGAFALLSYVLVYTPMKRRSPAALLVGSVPGAIPALLGWTASTGGLEAPGLALFGVALAWQIPHFLAIALYRKADYARAGIRTVPVVRGDDVAKWQTVAWAGALVPLCLLLVPLGAASWIYAGGALAISVWFLVTCLRGYHSLATPRWARRVFLSSLAYLPALAAFLLVDRLIL